MKPHLPLQLLGLALLACTAPAAYSAADTISINFTSGQNSPFDAGADWYDAAGNTGSVVIAADGDHDSSYQGGGSGVTLDYNSKNSWGYTDGVADNLLKGYLDDGSGINISLSGLLQQGFLSYDLTIYAATDNELTAGSAFTSKNVNGVDYTSDGAGGAILGTGAWGNSHEAEVNNKNSFTISGLTGDLSIYSTGSSQNPRGCIAGIKIVNTYTGTRVEAALNANTGAAWSTSELAGSAWTNTGSYAALTLTGENAMTVSDGVQTDAVIVTGTGEASSLTLNEGSLTMTGPSIISTGAGVTLTINTALTADGVVVLDGAEGSVIVGGTANVGGLSGNGNLTIAEGGKVTISGDASSAFTGTLNVADWRNAANFLESSNANWSFTGTAVFTAANTGGSITYSELRTIGGDLLTNASGWRFDGITLTLAGGDNIGEALIAETVTKTGDGTATIANGSSDIGTLNIDGGTVKLTTSGYQIDTVNIASGATLSLEATGANIAGRPAINMAGDATLDLRNCGAGGAANKLTADIVIDPTGATNGATIKGSLFGNASELAGTITGTGNLAFTHTNGGTNDYIVSSVIADKSDTETLHVNLDKDGRFVSFRGANTYSGGTTVKAGIFELSGNGTAGTGAVAIETNGTVRIQRAMTWNNVTTGSGQFVVNAAGSTVTVSRGEKDAWENSFADFHGTIDIQHGTLQLGLANEDAKGNTVASLGDGKVKIGDGAILALGTGVITLGNAMELANGARINVLDGSNNAEANYTLSGPVTLAGAATINHAWNKSFKISGLIQDAENATGKLVLQGSNDGIFILSGDNNTFSGGIELKNGKLHAQGNESLGTGTTTVANGAELSFKREGGNVASATIQVNNADGAAVATLKAKPAETRAAAAPVYTNVKVASTGITRVDVNKKASVANAAIEVSSTYSISNAELNATQITLNDAAALTLTDVTLGAGTVLSQAAGASTTLSLTNTALILSSANTTIGSDAASTPTTALVTYDMAGASVSGSFTLDLTGDLLRSIAQQTGAPFTQIQITFDNVTQWSVADSDFRLAESLGYLGPNTPAVDAQDGKVVVTVTFNEVIPEPATATLGLTALLGLMMRRRRRS